MNEMAHFISAVPKAELHVHIEGTIEADLLLTIADRNGIALPYKSAADVVAGQNKGKSDPKQNLDSFIEVLDVCRGVLRNGRDYEDIGYGYLKRCRSEKIAYAEVMFDPQQGLRQGVGIETQLEALQSGSLAGARDFGVEVQWIMNFQRDWPAEEAMTILDAVRPYRDQIVGLGVEVCFEPKGDFDDNRTIVRQGRGADIRCGLQQGQLCGTKPTFIPCV